jgi:hypothetical protein
MLYEYVPTQVSLYPEHSTLPYDTLSIAFENTVFSLIPQKRYCFNRFCFEMVRQITLSLDTINRAQLTARTGMLFQNRAYCYSSILFWDKQKQMLLTVYHLVGESTDICCFGCLPKKIVQKGKQR